MDCDSSPDPFSSEYSQNISQALVVQNQDEYYEKNDYRSNGESSKQKRRATEEPQRPVQPKTTLSKSIREVIDAFESPKECIEGARDLLIKAAHFEDSRTKQTKILDLLNVFREFMENNGAIRRENTVLAGQLQRLEQTTQVLETSIQKNKVISQTAKAFIDGHKIPKITDPEPVAVTRPTMSSAQTKGTFQNKTSWADIAAQPGNQETGEATAWTRVGGRKKLASSRPRDNKRLILIQDATTRTSF